MDKPNFKHFYEKMMINGILNGSNVLSSSFITQFFSLFLWNQEEHLGQIKRYLIEPYLLFILDRLNVFISLQTHPLIYGSERDWLIDLC